jgi:adenosylcobinamide kinase / adenosylcobinamide-phosphate guanylyltransferase
MSVTDAQDAPGAQPNLTTGGNPFVSLVLGGTRSGKSSFAEADVLARGLDCLYLATSEAFDGEMEARIALHRERRGPEWTTIEEPLALADVLAAKSDPKQAILVDCLTLWLANLLGAEREVSVEFKRLVRVLAEVGGPVVLVSNEVGQGIVPDNALARRFRDEAGRLHQQIAAVAGRVVFVTAGLPQTLKDIR